MELYSTIYEHLKNQENEREITLIKTKEYRVNNKDFQNCLEDIKERLNIKLQSGRCSEFLIKQLANHRCHHGEKFGEKIEFYNSSEICDLIESIENGKVEKVYFERDLKGFLKTHHGAYASNGYSIVRNIREFWFKKKKIKRERFDEYERIINEFGKQNISAIMNAMHTKAMAEKAKNNELNGEWLIYKQHDDRYYYLCLATHYEGDPNIYKNKLLHCLSEFPELK